MNGPRKKSKKRSDTNSTSQPDSDQVVVFLDRSLGRHVIADALRAEEIKVEVHDDYFGQKSPDEEWLRFVAERNWIAITKDDRIRRRKSEIAAIREHKARVIVVVSKKATGKEMAAMLLKGWRRIIGLSAKTSAPFVAKIYRDGSVRLIENW